METNKLGLISLRRRGKSRGVTVVPFQEIKSLITKERRGRKRPACRLSPGQFLPPGPANESSNPLAAMPLQHGEEFFGALETQKNDNY